MRIPALMLGLLVLVVAACGSEDPGTEPDGDQLQPVETAAQELEFTGYLLRSDGETRICEALAESYPPQCGGTSYRVTGLDFGGADLAEAQGVSWTEQQVTLRGVLADDGETLMVSANPVLRGEPPPPTVGGQPGSASD